MTQAKRNAAGSRTIALGLLGGVALALIVWVAPKLGLSSISNPESEIITALKRTERDGLSVPLGPGLPTLVSERHHFDRIVVSLDLPSRSARAVSTLDLDGKVGATEVSALGVEKIAFTFKNDTWTPVDTDAPQLRDALALLEERRRALEEGAPEALAALVTQGTRAQALGDPRLAQWLQVQHRHYQVRGWYLRTERDQVIVTEEFRMEGDLPDRPVDEEGRRRLVLVREGGRLLFDGALM